MAKRDPRKRAESVAAIIASINVVPLHAIRLDSLIRGDSLLHLGATVVPILIISRNSYRNDTQIFVAANEGVMPGANQGPRRTRGEDNRGTHLSAGDR